MKNLKYILALMAFFSVPAMAQENNESVIKSITVEGGPIASKHFQSEDENFKETHGLAIVKVHTEGYGNWGVYYLSPNSVRDTSVGVGYVTNPLTIPMGPTELELSGALGLVTGYQDYPVPLLAGQARFKIHESMDGKWNVGLAAAALPYIMENDQTKDNNFGVVVTSPFLSVRYKLN